jgi:hypothetical protein
MLYSLGHGVTAATILELAHICLNNELDSINCKLCWKIYNTEKDAQMTELIQNCYLPCTTDNFFVLNDTIMPVPVKKLL